MHCIIHVIFTYNLKQDFGGTCVLYGNVNCTTANATTVGCVVYGGATSNCVFIIAVNLLISVLFGVFMCVYHLYYLIRSRTLIRIVLVKVRSCVGNFVHVLKLMNCLVTFVHVYVIHSMSDFNF